MKPSCAINPAVLPRGFDRLMPEMAFQRLPVRPGIAPRGLVGVVGDTQAGAFGPAHLANLPGFVAAADRAELHQMVATALARVWDRLRFPHPLGESQVQAAALPGRPTAAPSAIPIRLSAAMHQTADHQLPWASWISPVAMGPTIWPIAAH